MNRRGKKERDMEHPGGEGEGGQQTGKPKREGEKGKTPSVEAVQLVHCIIRGGGISEII